MKKPAAKKTVAKKQPAAKHPAATKVVAGGVAHKAGHPAATKKPAAKKPAAHKATVQHAASKKTAAAKKKPGLPVVAGGGAWCAVEALGASLRAQGWPVTELDVAALYLACTPDLDAGIPVAEAAAAAAEYGLAGAYLASWEEVVPHERNSPPLHETQAGLILDVDLPGRHVIYAVNDTWWSWGEPWAATTEFPDALVYGAWRATWRL